MADVTFDEYAKLNDSQRALLLINRAGGNKSPISYGPVVGSPFTLTSAWQKVATTTAATKALILAPIVGASAYDIEWVSVAAGAAAPTDTYGEGVLAGEDFSTRPAPIGDIYLKSATGQLAIVKVG